MPSSVDGLALVRDALLSWDTLVQAVFSGRREPPRKIEIRPVRLRAGRRIQLVSYDERRSTTDNLTAAVFHERLDGLLSMGWRTMHVATTQRTVTVRVSKRGTAYVHTGPGVGRAPETHDRQKQRLVTADAPFLRALGVTGADGRIRAAKRAKYAQVDKFCRMLVEVAPLDTLPRPVRVADLGCGSAHLTFGVHHLLREVLGIDADVRGVDVDASAATRNAERARALGWPTLRFEAGRIRDYEPDAPPDVVLALHACDTATDEALARAIAWRSRVVLAAPCCHHHVQRQLSPANAPPGHALLVRHPIVLQRFGDLLTDALRASILRMHGYRTDIVQFVATEHTPRNALIRAVRTGAAPSPAERAEYRELRAAWGVTPELERLLS